MIFKEHIKDVGYRPFFSGSELRDLGINPKSTGKGFLYTWNANGSLRSVTDLKGVTGNVSDVLLKFQQSTNQYNTK